MKREIRMAIIRPVGAPISRNFYNSQEIGLARGLSHYGVNVDVYVAGEGVKVKNTLIDSAGSGAVRLLEVPFFKLPEISHAIYPKLKKLLKDGHYDFIQVNEESELTSFLVARFAKRYGIPLVVYQGMYAQITGRLRALFQKCYDRILLPSLQRNINMAITKTTYAQKYLESKGFTNTRVIPVGLDPSPFVNRKERNWRKEYDISDESPIILYVGIFERRRNVDFMLDLANKLAGEGVSLVMAGTGPEHERIKIRVREEKLNNVRLVGSVAQENLPSLYRESSLFLLPSNYEIYGMVVLEAMYFGVPVISTRTAGPEDIIEQSNDGILLGDLEIGEWVSAILNLLQNPEKLKHMGSMAEKKVRKTLTWESIACDYKDYVIKPLNIKHSKSIN